jgi:hypothetical protein
VPRTAALIANTKGASATWNSEASAVGTVTLSGTFVTPGEFFANVGFGSGPPAGTGFQLTPAGQTNRLYAARYSEKLDKLIWAISANGAGSGMTSQAGYDIVMTLHDSLGITVGGMMTTKADFGHALVKALTPDSLGSPFIVHLNSEAELDHCP